MKLPGKTFYFFHFAFSFSQALVMPTQEASQTVSRIIIFPTHSSPFLPSQNLKVKSKNLAIIIFLKGQVSK